MGVELEIALLLATAMAEHAVGFENRAVGGCSSQNLKPRRADVPLEVSTVRTPRLRHSREVELSDFPAHTSQFFASSTQRVNRVACLQQELVGFPLLVSRQHSLLALSLSPSLLSESLTAPT